MSNRLTFSLASLIVLIAFGLIFAPMSVMAHDLVDDVETTPATHGLQHVAGTTLTQAEHDAQHKTAPAVESIELVDIEAREADSAADTDDTSSTVSGSTVLLVADVDATAPIKTDLTSTTAGQFRVKIMFDADVYNAIAADTAAAAADLGDATDLTITARLSSGGANVFGTGAVVSIVTADHARVADDTDTDDVDESLRGFYLTLSVAADTTNSDFSHLPIDVWIRVNEGAVTSRTGLDDNGVTEYGTDNTAGTGDATLDTAMLPKKFTVVAGFPVAATAMDNGPVKNGEPIEVTLSATTGTLPTLAPADFTVMEGTTELTPTVSGSTLTITPGTGTTDTTVTVAPSTAGAIKISFAQISITVDRTPPSVVLGDPTPAAPKTGQKVSVPVSFTGAANGETILPSEVTITGGLTPTVAIAAANSATIEFTPTAAGTVTVTVAANAVMDDAGNGNMAQSSSAISVTRVADPAVDVMATAAPTTVGGGDEIIVTLSATAPAMVPDLTPADFSVTEGSDDLTLAADAWNNTAKTLTIMAPAGTAGADTTITIAAATPAAGSTAKISFTEIEVMVDRTAPMVTIDTSMVSSPRAGDEVTVTISVGSDVATGAVALTDITVMQDASGNQKVLEHEYNTTSGAVTFTPTAESTVTVTVDADVVMDAVGNGNDETSSSAITVAAAREAVAVTATPAATTVGGADEIVITLSAAAPATVPPDLSNADFSIMEGETTIISLPEGAWNNAAKTLTFTTSAGTAGTDTTITVEPSEAGMEKISFDKVSVMVDRTGPRVGFSQVTGAKANAAVMVTITVAGAAASEAVAVTDIDVVQTLSDGTTAALTPIYNAATGVVTFTPTAESTVTVSVDADAVMDEFGNSNAATSTVDITVGAADAVDTTAPALTPTVGNPDASGVIAVTLAFSEMLSAAPTVTAAASPVAIENTFVVSDVTADTANANTYMVKVTPSAATTADIPAGTVTLTVSATDANDNAMTQDVGVSLAARPLVDTTPPSLISVGTGAPDATTGAIVVTLKFNEALKAAPTVTHAASTGIENTYTVSAVADDGDATTTNTYVVTVTPTKATTADIPEGTVTLTVSAMDASDNPLKTGNTADVKLAARTAPPKNEIAAKGYRVIVGPGFDDRTLPGVTVHEIANFPADLATFLIGGGTIDVVATGGTVRINELMVARDSYKLGALPGEPTDGQWIELANLHATEAATGITVHFSSAKPAPAKPTGTQDRFSNTVGQGWNFEGKFGAAVLNGSTHPTNPVNFISIRRTNYGDGANQGHWGTAIASLLFAPGRVGTPGATNTVATFDPVENTYPNRTDVLISEVANRMDNSREWIELKGPANKSLKNWRLSIATAVGTETTIFQFPNNDNIKISGNGHLLLTDVNPLNSELEADFANGAHAPVRYKNAIVNLGALPNDGNFVLILRNGGDKSKVASIEDIAGHSTNLGRANPYTTLWPLTGNVGHISSHNKLAAGPNDGRTGTVYRRVREGINGYSATAGNKLHESAFGQIGFTGLGYDRNADATDPGNGGTPGYPHGNYKGDGANAMDDVRISEIMFVTGNGGPTRNRNLPQWIEIHNASDVNSVNLTNWRLEIVNSGRNADGSQYSGNFRENVDLGGTIPPNQTYLIVEHNADSFTRLPRERIKIVGKKFSEDLLNPHGFHLTLKAKRHKAAHEHVIVDTVGNLNNPAAGDRRADARSFAGNAWELSDLGGAIAEDRSRISISRRVNAGGTQPRPGTKQGAWVLTDEDPRYSGLIRLTHYGRTDDRATPGYTIGAPLPVQLSTFRADRLATGEIVIRWATESELNNAGFNILRSDSRDGQFTKLNNQLIAGQGTTSERTAYEFTDTSAKPNVVYYYQIQDVSFDGDVATLRTSRLRGHVSPAGKATTTWGELKSLQ